MSNALFNFKKALQVFGSNPDLAQDMQNKLPLFARGSDNRILKSWSLSEMPQVGAVTGFLKKPKTPLSVAIFVTKGGVLKSSLTLNFARMAALHDIRTCVVGLDMQGDITTALSGEETSEDVALEDALDRMSQLRGLADVFTGHTSLDDVIRPTDIPTLSFIPETPELVALDQSLVNRNRREYWLRDQVIEPLKRCFDLVLIDCSPNWNRLITNALVASDALVSPLECKINNFRNLKMFRALIEGFKTDMHVDFSHSFIATRLSPSRKLSREIFDWYRANVPGCLESAIRESIQGEEAIAMRVSIPEYAPTSLAADEIRGTMAELWHGLLNDGTQKRLKKTVRARTSLEEEDQCL